MNRPILPTLHLVTDDHVLSAPGFLETATDLLRAGGARIALHLRAPRLSGRALWETVSRLSPVAREAGARLLVNDRVDVALAGGTDGVHLGERSMPAPDARRLLGPDPWIGLSVHSAADAIAAAETADFLIAGTVYETGSHPGRPGRGPGWLRDLRQLPVPVIGIGGISPDRVPEVRAAGAAGVAVLSGVWSAADPRAALDDYMAALEVE